MDVKGLRDTFRALAAGLACVAAGAQAGEIVQVDGVPHVRNGAEPAQGRETVRLEELWRIGGEDDDVFFGLVTQALCDEAGNIYLLDSQLCEVYVYSPDGERLRTLFREGEGPGEVTQPRGLALLGDGSVGVVREFPGLMVRVDRQNSPLPNIEVQPPGGAGFMLVDTCLAGGNTLVLGGTITRQGEESFQERTHYLGIIGLDGNETSRLAEYSYRRDYERLVIAERQALPSFWWASAVGPDGRVYVAPYRDRYAVEIHTPAGDLERVITRDCAHCRRTNDEWQRLYDGFEAALKDAPVPYTIEIERDEYDILAMQRGVRVRRDGSLWVLPCRGVRDQPPGIMLTFDVFDPEGHFARQVSFAAPHSGLRDGFFFVGPDRILVVTGLAEAVLAQYGVGSPDYETGDDGSIMEVVCFRMADGGPPGERRQLAPH